MKSKWQVRLAMLAVILLGSWFRWQSLDWDDGKHFHPDERMITMVAGRVHLPSKISWASIANKESPLNPKFFAYGSLPIYLLHGVGWGLNLVSKTDYLGYDELTMLGRQLAVLFDLGTLVIIVILGKKLKNQTVGWLAGLLYALAVFPTQDAHFYTVDGILTFWIMLFLLGLVDSWPIFSVKRAFGLAVILGLAVGTKLNGLVLLAPLGVRLLMELGRGQSKKQRVSYGVRVGLISAGMLVVGLTAFLLAEPYAGFEFAEFKRQILEQLRMSRDAFVFPYTLQYVGTKAYWYPLKQMVVWGTGGLLGLVAVGGVLAVSWAKLGQVCRRLIGRAERLSVYSAGWLVVLAFFWVYWLVMGRSAVKFMRYYLPLYPVLMLAAAWWLTKLVDSSLDRVKLVGKLLVYLVVINSLLWSLAFSSVLRGENPRISATNWILKNVPRGSVIATEHWDDEVPMYAADDYQIIKLNLYDPETEAKFIELREKLEKAKVIVLASNRLYKPIRNLRKVKYPKTAKYYDQLFAGRLGFNLAATFTNRPRLWGLEVVDDEADESFTVYDHPKVMVFIKN